MVMGVGYRLLAMLFPAKPPTGAPTWLTLLLFELGLLGLAGAMMTRSPRTGPFAIVLALGLLLFLGLVLRMRRHLVPAPAKLRRPDWGVLHVAQALLYLGVTTGVGLSLALGTETNVTGIGIYGVVGLLGFLAQMILGVEMRLLPMFAFTESFARSGHEALPPSPHDMAWRPLQAVSLAGWTLGVPLLAWGLGAEVGDAAGEGAVRAGAWALLAGTVAAGASTARVLAHAFRRG
jgi:hypothetical protein